MLKPENRHERTVRVSVSFPASTYLELERIAAAKKVSVAWVVRDAADRYLAEQWPLLQSGQGTRHV